jgi:dihydroorotate dehydrogenase electron transfer subunit
MKKIADFTARKVVSIYEINDRTSWIRFDGTMDAIPGQFVMAWLPGVGEKPFSIASMDPFSLLVVAVGPLSRALHQLNKGDLLWIKGPLGSGFSIEGEKLLLVGGGYGAAPLYPLAIAARACEKKVHVCLGARESANLLLSDKFLQLKCQVSLATDDGSQGIRGFVTAIVKDAVAITTYDTLYACGPTGLLTALVSICRAETLNYQLSWEAYMRCGMGLCGSCEVSETYDPSLPPGWLSCFDGPVFRKKWDIG